MGCNTNPSFERFLQQIQTPARYLGSEHNSVQKAPESVSVRFALCYPDMYEIGMSHLGSQILYAVINAHPAAACERAYLPAPDALGVVREQGLALTSLETKTPLGQFDFVGITLQHELNYTSVLALMDLSAIDLQNAVFAGVASELDDANGERRHAQLASPQHLLKLSVLHFPHIDIFRRRKIAHSGKYRNQHRSELCRPAMAICQVFHRQNLT